MADDPPDFLTQRQGLVDAGVPQSQIDGWQHGLMQSQLQSGMSQDDVNKAWGIRTPDLTSAANAVAGYTPPEVATDPWQYLEAGAQKTVAGTIYEHGEPSVVRGKDPGFFDDLAYAVGGSLDLPISLPAFGAGVATGGAVGAAAGAESGPGAAATAVGGAALGGALASGLPVVLRHALVDAYNTNGPYTWRDFWHGTAKALYAARGPAAIGAITGPFATLPGMSVTSRVMMGNTGAAVTRSAVNAVSYATAATAVQSAMAGRAPDFKDFATGAIFGLGLNIAGETIGETIGATNRFVPHEAGEVLSSRLQDVYTRYGSQPVTMGLAMTHDLAVRSDMVGGYSSTMERIQPALGDYAPAEPTVTYHGSRHLFGQFDVNQVGQGEGYQGYGHGLYVSDEPGVAEHYRTAGAPQGEAGNLYRVHMKAPQETLLDLDKPFDEQTPEVQAALRATGLPLPVGQVAGPEKPMMDWLRQNEKIRRFGNPPDENALEPQELAAKLRAAGVRGTKYLIGADRGKGEGRHNYVVFHHDDLEITHRNGEPLEKPTAAQAGDSMTDLQQRADEQGAIEHASRVLALQGDGNDAGEPPPPPPPPPRRLPPPPPRI